jgi:hypothetical protein
LRGFLVVHSAGKVCEFAIACEADVAPARFPKDWNHSDQDRVPNDKMVEKRRQHVERNQCQKRPNKEDMDMECCMTVPGLPNIDLLCSGRSA